MDNNNDLHRKVAILESKLDQVESELSYIHNLLLDCGFPEGVKTLKMTIEELLSEVDLDPKKLPPEAGGSTQTFDFF